MQACWQKAVGRAEKLKRSLARAVAQPACVICHEEFKVGNELCRLPGCAHCYHAECIGRWLAIKASCPLCNADLKAQWTAADVPSEGTER